MGHRHRCRGEARRYRGEYLAIFQQEFDTPPLDFCNARSGLVLDKRSYSTVIVDILTLSHASHDRIYKGKTIGRFAEPIPLSGVGRSPT